MAPDGTFAMCMHASKSTFSESAMVDTYGFKNGEKPYGYKTIEEALPVARVIDNWWEVERNRRHGKKSK